MAIKISPRRKVMDCLGDGWRTSGRCILKNSGELLYPQCVNMSSLRLWFYELNEGQFGISRLYRWFVAARFESDYEISTYDYTIAVEIQDALNKAELTGYTITVR